MRLNRVQPYLNFRSLRVKFITLLLPLFTVTIAAIALLLVNRNLAAAKQEVLRSAQSFAQISVSTLGNDYVLYYQSGYGRYVSLTQQIYALQPDLVQAQIIQVQTGNILADSAINTSATVSPPAISQTVADPRMLQAVNQGQTLELATHPGGDIDQIVVPYAGDFGSHPFSIRYRISYAAAESAARQSIVLIVGAVLAAGLAILLAIIVLTNRAILNPISRVIKGTERIAKGELGYTVSAQTQDELNDLAVAVNNMAARLRRNITELQKLDAAKTEFMLIASHNLRTPLTILQNYVPLVFSQDKLTHTKKLRYQQGITDALSRLNTLVEEMLMVISLREESSTSKLSAISVDQLLKAVVANPQAQTDDKGVRLDLQVEPDIKVLAEKDLLTKALQHIIGNAIKFSPPGGVVTIKAQADDRDITLSIHDQGPGMSPEQQQALFQMFHRGTSILTYDYEGVGLGLYLARLILLRFKARITIQSAKNQGTTVILAFPAVK